MKIIQTITLLFIFSFIQLNAQECYPTVFNGEGTFYESIAGTSSGNCSLPIAADDFLYCAMNEIQYDNSNACGACVNITGPKGSITLRVVDRCPECLPGDIDMTQEAFSQIADVIDGRVPISWSYTTCEINTDNSIKIFFKEGTTQYWTSIQFRNLTHAIASMEYQSANGDWINTERKLYNFFEEPTGIPTPMNLRLTSVLGEELIFENIDFTNLIEVEINTSKQFSTPEDCNDNTLSIGENIELEKNSYNILTTEGELITSINGESNFSKISLYNLSGQQIELISNIIDEKSVAINTEGIAAGIYIIRLEESNKSIFTKKIIIR